MPTKDDLATTVFSQRKCLACIKVVTEGRVKDACPDLKGLCMTCYTSAKKLVHNGTYTWQQLADKGLCIMPSSKVDGTINVFQQALDNVNKKGVSE